MLPTASAYCHWLRGKTTNLQEIFKRSHAEQNLQDSDSIVLEAERLAMVVKITCQARAAV